MKHLVFLMILLTSNTYANSLTKEEFNQAMSYFNTEALKSLIESGVYNKKGQTYLAINFRFRNDNEILVVTKDQLHELPHDIRIKVLKELNS